MKFVLAASAAVGALTFGAAAHAQDAPADDGVVVTASRAATAGFTAPTPTTIVGADALDRRQATTVSQLLNEIPAFRPTTQPGSNAIRTQQVGGATADLRGLGAQRTLVLVDGARLVPQAPANNTGAVVVPDLNTIPSLMIERVEVVTGGASAQWGSDAVGGVVNILLRKTFEGFQARVQGGVSERGDNENVRVGLLGGINPAANFHVVGGVDYSKSNGVGDIYTRDWGREEWQLAANAQFATNGQPANIVAPRVHSTLPPGGLITGASNGTTPIPNFALREYAFGPGGTVAPFQIGQFARTAAGALQPFMVGGDGQSLAKGVRLVPAVERIAPYARLQYDVSETANVYAELGFARVKGVTSVLASRSTADTIRIDNPFLPAAVRNAMTAQGATSITVARSNHDFGGNAEATIINETPRVVLGAEGDLGDRWSWDGHLAWGSNLYTNKAAHNRIRQRYNFALDAVTSGGQAVCRATVPGASFNAAAAGCVPINIFGEGAPSQAAIDYVTGTSSLKATYEQKAAAVNLQGELFDIGPGAISVALGAEYRREAQAVTADPIALAGGFEASNGQQFRGNFDVKEAYAETIIPLARDEALFKSLDVNAAVRIADYSTAGTHTTWKVGSTYEPVDGLLLRATRSQDLRAPALFELYSPGSISNLPATVRGQSASSIPQNSSVGNPNLTPEEAETWTVGGVVSPPGSGLAVSLDYYDINLKDAITTILGSAAGSLCTAGQQVFCNAFTYNASGVPTSYRLGFINAASIQTQGYDLAVSYRTPLSRFADVPGSIVVSVGATYTTHVWVDLGAGAGRVDRANENNIASGSSTPRLRTNTSLTYSVGPASLTTQVLTISEGALDNTWNTSAATSANVNRVPAMAYVNLQGSYKLGEGDRFELFGSVNNLLDQDPPPAPSTTVFTPTNGVYYDTVGRAFQLGLGVRF